MKKHLQQLWQKMKWQDRKRNQSIEKTDIPRNTSVRKFLHYLARRKDRGASKQ